MMKNQFAQQADDSQRTAICSWRIARSGSERLRSTDYQRIEQAIHFLEANFRRQPSLDEIADSIHLSKYHFQRLFKRWAGISPSQFLRFLTLEYAKERLQESQSILDAALDAGLSGPGRLHDLFVTFEATTPGEYKQQGAGLQITYGIHDTPFGRCLLATTARGICALHFLQNGDAAAAVKALKEYWPQASLVEDRSQTQPLVDQIFAAAPTGQSRPFHLLLKGTNFQVKVWQALLAIPPGMIVSYQDVADLMDRPNATRAVAGAVARNPIAYLIPCHRVISSTGRAHRYRWGTARKKAMLGWEASRRAQREGSDTG
jgi:AraC family transcriptional regulator of adaptative response/methylated-DNA-[protein]-cysteine methyltransferase